MLLLIAKDFPGEARQGDIGYIIWSAIILTVILNITVWLISKFWPKKKD